MTRLVLTLILSTIGGNFVIHYLKNFLLREKRKFRPDLDGWLERLCLTYIIIEAPRYIILIPAVIALKVIYRLLQIGFFTGGSKTREPGAAFQKVLLKGELAFDLILSPALAILLGIIFK